MNTDNRNNNSTARLRHHFSLMKAYHQRRSYEELPDADPDGFESSNFYSRENLRRGYRRCLTLGLALGLTLVWCLLPRALLTSSSSNKNLVLIHHHEIIPTLLQVVDVSEDASASSSSSSVSLLYALDNPLYDRLAQAILHRDGMETSPRLRDAANRLQESPALHVDLHYNHDNNSHEVLLPLQEGSSISQSNNDSGQRQRPPDAITLRWNLGVLTNEESPLVADEHAILALECGDDDDMVVLDAATVPQARATHRHTVCHRSNSLSPPPQACLQSNNNDINEWYIPIPSHAIRYSSQDTSSCRFRLYDATRPVNYYLLAETEPLQLTAPAHQPLHIHLSWTETVDTVLVQFVTAAAGTPVVELASSLAAAAAAAGEYAPSNSSSNSTTTTSSSSSTQKFTGTTTTYTATDLCQAPANTTAPGQFQPPGYLHTVALTGLLANTAYRYRVGLAAGQGVTWTSAEYEFTTALEAGDATPHAYLVYGDQGFDGGDGWSAGAAVVTAAIAQEVNGVDGVGGVGNSQQQQRLAPTRSIHHIGDLSYAQGAAHQWDQWFHMIETFATRVPLMVAAGNHEYDHELGGAGKDPSEVSPDGGFHPVWGNFGNDSGGECGVPVAKRFTMPADGNGVFWYSYDCGLVHTIVLSSEHDLGEDSPQYQWLHENLRNIQRHVTPWVVVETHRPLYEGEIYWDQNSVGVAMRMEIEDLLYDYQVDAVLAGHYHAYHRSCDGLYQGRCDSGGPIHLTIGTAGAHLDEADIATFVNPWSAKVLLSTYGYGRVTVQNATALHFEFVQASANETGKVLDDIWILRDR